MHNLILIALFVALIAIWVGFRLIVKPRVDRYLAGSQEHPSDVSYTRSKAPPPDPDSPLETERRRLIQRTERAMTRYEEAQRRRVA